MKEIVVECGFEDIASDQLDYIKKVVAGFAETLPLKPTGMDLVRTMRLADHYSELLVHCLRNEWGTKATWLREHFPGGRCMRVEVKCPSLDFRSVTRPSSGSGVGTSRLVMKMGTFFNLEMLAEDTTAENSALMLVQYEVWKNYMVAADNNAGKEGDDGDGNGTL